MSTSLSRSIATGMLAGLLVAVAAPAMAATFGGYLTSCGSSQVVTSKGWKAASGGITVTAPNRSFTDTSGVAAVITLKGTNRVGAWGVTGSGATNGSGFCS